MLETPAVVTRAEGDIAWVVSRAPASCGVCAGKGCGSSVFARMLHADEPEYPVRNPIGAAPGEEVVIGVPDGTLLHASVAAYLLPLFALMLAVALGTWFFGELGGIFAGLCGLLLAGAWLSKHSAAAVQPVVLRRGKTTCAHH